MLDRQRGAAHVPVIVFLLTLILFFGALAFGYVVMENNGKVEADIAAAMKEKKKLEFEVFFMKHYLEDITAEIGEAGEWKGRPGFDYGPYADGNPVTPLQNVALPEGVKSTIANFARDAGVTSTTGLASFFGQIKTALDQSKGRIASLETQQTTLETNISELQSALDTVKGERDTEVSSLNGQLQQKDVEYQAEIDNKTQQLAKSNANYAQIREQLTDNKEQNRVERKRLNGEIEVRDARINAIAAKVKLINPPHAADAMVLDASQATGRAWINIGRRDMLAVGTRFSITAPDSSAVKAYGTVKRVENDRAELLVTGERDRFDPIVRGDEVHNELYSPGLRRNVFMLGRFGHPHSKPMVKRILESLGNTVVDKIGPQVDLVLVGGDMINEDGSGYTPVTDSDEYKEVLRLGIETATLNKVREFLKLSD